MSQGRNLTLPMVVPMHVKTDMKTCWCHHIWKGTSVGPLYTSPWLSFQNTHLTSGVENHLGVTGVTVSVRGPHQHGNEGFLLRVLFTWRVAAPWLTRGVFYECPHIERACPWLFGTEADCLFQYFLYFYEYRCFLLICCLYGSKWI